MFVVLFHVGPATRRSDVPVECLVRPQLFQACLATEHAVQYCVLTAAFSFKTTILHRFWYYRIIPYVRLDTVGEYPWGKNYFHFALGSDLASRSAKKHATQDPPATCKQ